MLDFSFKTISLLEYPMKSRVEEHPVPSLLPWVLEKPQDKDHSLHRFQSIIEKTLGQFRN